MLLLMEQMLQTSLSPQVIIQVFNILQVMQNVLHQQYGENT